MLNHKWGSALMAEHEHPKSEDAADLSDEQGGLTPSLDDVAPEDQDAHQHLLTALADVTFAAHEADDGTIKIDHVESSGSLSRDALRTLMNHDVARQAAHQATQTQQPVTFEATLDPTGNAARWHVALVMRPGHTYAWHGAVQAHPEAEAHHEATPTHRAYEPKDVAVARRTGVEPARTSGHTPTPHAQRNRPYTLPHEIVEMLPDALVILGYDDQLLYANAAVARLIGADSVQQVLDLSIWDIVHPDSKPLVQERRRQLRRGTASDYAEHKLIRLDGSVIPVEVASVPIVYRGQHAALSTMRDVSGRYRMAETVASTLDLFDKAFHLGPSALMIVRLRDGVVLEVSERMVELVGYEADDIIGSSITEYDTELDAEARRRLVRRLLREGRLSDLEISMRHRDGSMHIFLCGARYADIDGAPCALVSAVDISERKQAAKAVHESRELLSKVFRASPVAIAIYQEAGEAYFDVNEAMCELVGYSRDELLGHTPDELAIWADEQQRDVLRERLQQEPAVYEYEIAFRRASGEVVRTLSSFQRIQVDGEPCVLAVMVDITSREEAKEALVEAKEKAEEVAHFRSAVLSNMTHEVRTPLTVILGFTSMLREGVQEEYQRFVSLIERSGRRLLLTLDSLLDLAQIESGTLEVEHHMQNVGDVVHAITGPLRDHVEAKDLHFTLDLPDEGLYALLDYELLNRVLNHLIDNAVKFTTEGEVAVRVTGDDDYVYIHVEDTGVGIEPVHIPRIFEAFVQESEGLTRSHQGSGLGLTVSKRMVELMGGYLEASSAKGKGSVFSVALPRTHGDPVRPGSNA